MNVKHYSVRIDSPILLLRSCRCLNGMLPKKVRLQEEQPERFPDVQLRTLQRRVRAWRHVMERGLIFGGQNASEVSAEAAAIGLDKAPILQ